MKILFLTQTTKKGPASRIRGYQMARALQKCGVKTHVSPGIPTLFYPLVYTHSIGILKVPFYLWALGKRLLQLPWMSQFDLVVIQKEVFPHFYPVTEHILKKLKVPTLFDFDDALFARQGRANFLPLILKWGTGVLAGNDFLRHYAIKHNPNVLVFPSSIDLKKVLAKKKFSKNGITTLGWIGSRSSNPHLKLIQRPLIELLKKRSNVRLMIVSDQCDPSWDNLIDEGKVLFKKWNPSGEKKWIRKMDIGLSPLKPGVWSQGKCGYKTLQYMAQGIPVLASPVGVNKELVQEGVNGYLASSSTEWKLKLERLLRNKSQWSKMGKCGRKRVESDFNAKKQAELMKNFFKKTLKHLSNEKN